MATKDEKKVLAALITGVGVVDSNYEQGMLNGLLLAQGIMLDKEVEIVEPEGDDEEGSFAWAMGMLMNGVAVRRSPWKGDLHLIKAASNIFTVSSERGLERCRVIALDDALAKDWVLL